MFENKKVLVNFVQEIVPMIQTLNTNLSFKTMKHLITIFSLAILLSNSVFAQDVTVENNTDDRYVVRVVWVDINNSSNLQMVDNNLNVTSSIILPYEYPNDPDYKLSQWKIWSKEGCTITLLTEHGWNITDWDWLTACNCSGTTAVSNYNLSSIHTNTIDCK